MQTKKFTNRAERLFLKANPGAVITGWVKKPARVTYPTGLEGISGSFHAVATGYRPRLMLAQWDAETGLAVR